MLRVELETLELDSSNKYPSTLQEIKEAHCKKMLKKSVLLTGQLNLWDTLPQGLTYSSAQRFLCRRTESTFPMSAWLLGQSVPPVAGVRDEHLGRRAKAKPYYDKAASRDLVSLSFSLLENLCTLRQA